MQMLKFRSSLAKRAVFRILTGAGLVYAALVFASPVQAGPPGLRGGPPGQDGCEKLKLTPDQEKNIQAEHLAFADRLIDLEAAIEHARLNFEKIVGDEKSDAKSIMSAGERVSEAFAKKAAAEQELRATIFAKDLKPNQRGDALRCFGPEMHKMHPGMCPHPRFDHEPPRPHGDD